jgi:hypothetical protein
MQYTLHQIRTRLRTATQNAGGTTAWGRVHGISHAYIVQAMNGRGYIGPKILAALGIEKRVEYHGPPINEEGELLEQEGVSG